MRLGSSLIFLHVHLVVLAPFVGKTILSPLNCLGILIENLLAINVEVYFWTLNSISLIRMSDLRQLFWSCGLQVSSPASKTVIFRMRWVDKVRWWHSYHSTCLVHSLWTDNLSAPLLLFPFRTAGRRCKNGRCLSSGPFKVTWAVHMAGVCVSGDWVYPRGWMGTLKGMWYRMTWKRIL